MNKEQLAAKVAERHDLTKRNADEIVSTVLKEITDSVAGGESVRLHGFGTFERRATAPRTGRNPQTGEEIRIPAGQKVAFRPTKAFKQTL